MVGVSVVVAIYKVEQYLEQCLESIVNQTYDDIEIILVDDGSPDKCPQICDTYAGKDSRIRVIHQENQGAVKARWNGAITASGRYVSFIDGDDWLEKDMYEKMMRLTADNDVDIVVTGYKEDTTVSCIDKRNNIDSGIYSGEKLYEIYDKVLYFDKFYESGIVPALWNKLIKRELLFSDYTPAHPIIKMGEDAAVSYPMIARAKSIVIANEICPYHYRIVQGSMSRTFDDRFFERAIFLLSGLKDNLAKNKNMMKHLKYYGLFISQIGINQILSKNCKLSITDKKEIIRNYSRNFKAIGMDEEADWESFDGYSRRELKLFLDENMNGLIASIFGRKIARKVGILK